MTSAKKLDILPASLPPRGLRREQAAAYISVSPATFDKMVHDGRMPAPKRVGARVIWDRLQIDEAFSSLVGDDNDDEDPWSQAKA